MNIQSIEANALLTPSEVAAILYVDPKTVTRWAIAGKLNSIRTPGGHRRFLKSEILALMSWCQPHPEQGTMAAGRLPGVCLNLVRPGPTWDDPPTTGHGS